MPEHRGTIRELLRASRHLPKGIISEVPELSVGFGEASTLIGPVESVRSRIHHRGHRGHRGNPGEAVELIEGLRRGEYRGAGPLLGKGIDKGGLRLIRIGMREAAGGDGFEAAGSGIIGVHH